MKQAIAFWSVIGALLLVAVLCACASITNLAVAPATTAAQQIYRAGGVVEAAARWVEVYVVQPKADPIASASMVDSVRVAAEALQGLREQTDPTSRLNVIGEAIIGLVLVAEAQEGIAETAPGFGGLSAALIGDASARLGRLGAARARLADLRVQLSNMTGAGRDPTAAEWTSRDLALEGAYQAMLAAARLPKN